MDYVPALPGRFPAIPTPELDEAAQEFVEAAVAGRVAAASSAGRSRARKRLEAAENKLQRSIEKTINDRVPKRVEGSKDWVDPFVGLRGRYHLNDKWYLAARADVGGFEVGSDLTWQVYGGFGYQISKNTVAELGYRHLDIDYTRGGFVYDVYTSGFIVGVGFKF